MPMRSKNIRKWPTTHWSLVGRAGSGGAEARRQALATLLRIYLPALRRHVVRRGMIQPQLVDDVLQEFLVSRILEKDIIRLADQGRGNFRTFLATALDRFLLNWLRYQSAAKRKAIQAKDFNCDLDSQPDKRTPMDSFDY